MVICDNFVYKFIQKYPYTQQIKMRFVKLFL